MKRLLLFFYLIFLLNISNAQFFQTGQDPASIKWRQINTENFQLIYPDYYELQSQKLAFVLEKVYNYGSYSLNHKPKKISVILHTQTVKSNGLVAWAPKRSEFYTTPHQGIYPQDWLEQLALHEFRHVVQIDKLNERLPGIIKLLLGESGTALVFGAYLPWWFIEGDAVVTETALSNYGRGRFPSFLMEHKAQVVEKGNYKYDKAYNGSYKDFVADHYKLGYYMVGETRKQFGSEVWDSVLNRVGKKPFSLNPFNKTLKQSTGLNKVELYNSVFENLRNQWIKADENFVSIKFDVKSPKNKTYTNYKYNHWLNDTTLVSYKTSLNKIPSFVVLSKTREEKNIFYPGVIFNESVNYRDELIVWSEQIPDLRWSHSGKSLIRIFNINTREIIELQPEFKCFSPSLSHDKKSVAVVETDFGSNNYLTIYSVTSGKLIKRIQTKNNNYLFSPEWLNDIEIAVVLLTAKGKRLAKINIETEEVEVLVEQDLGEIKHLKYSENNIYFISSYSGKNGLYKYNQLSKEIQFLYEPRFGAESPAISGLNSKIALSNYTSDGFQIIELSNIKENATRFESVNKASYLLADELAGQEMGIPDFSYPDTLNFASKKYSKVSNLINFHSWAPAFVNVNTYEIVPGASLMSQNKLGTAETILGYKWDVAEKTGKFFAGYTFKGWYPVFDIEINSGKSASEYLLIEQTKNQNGDVVQQDTSLQRYTWKHTTAEFGIKVPLNLTKGVFGRLLQPEVQYDYSFYDHDSSTPEHFFKGNFQSLSYRLYFHQLLKQSSQDVFPNFGLIIDGSYRHSPTGKNDLGSVLAGQSILYLPGFLANHGVKIYSGIQDKKISDTFSFSEAIRYPRGWGKRNTTRMKSLALDYKLPLFYPEWSVGGIIYIQRVKASLFGDYASLNGYVYHDGEITGTYNKNISSLGIELSGDVNFMRFYAPTEIGFRASYIPELGNVYFDFLFSIDFDSL
ncbi:MAG: hypothetical protein HN778_10730 [Prolixibacteraceae bacterium]|jgi:hypothetical protein|nr:hypothetical protein [Prolixibacteraceae bacterium]MBT6766388.1 hypothetical protein [Prolixibacteraceae bacterium]MBT7000707.1 hypothetical protein [Prolixibacteraceae bacterium]MBT7395295.1 hypothetical protein [Prolixibacteraceae bacterium]